MTSVYVSQTVSGSGDSQFIGLDVTSRGAEVVPPGDHGAVLQVVVSGSTHRLASRLVGGQGAVNRIRQRFHVVRVDGHGIIHQQFVRTSLRRNERDSLTLVRGHPLDDSQVQSISKGVADIELGLPEQSLQLVRREGLGEPVDRRPRSRLERGVDQFMQRLAGEEVLVVTLEIGPSALSYQHKREATNPALTVRTVMTVFLEEPLDCEELLKDALDWLAATDGDGEIAPFEVDVFVDDGKRISIGFAGPLRIIDTQGSNNNLGNESTRITVEDRVPVAVDDCSPRRSASRRTGRSSHGSRWYENQSSLRRACP